MGIARRRSRGIHSAVDVIPLMYTLIRNVHLLLASFSLPFLIMYGVSAVQMSHSKWFHMKPAVEERDFPLNPGQVDARAVARDVMNRERSIKGEISNVQTSAAGISLRIVVPGTVHELKYDPVSGRADVKSSVAGVMGMLNRLHHWAGFWHEPASMEAWAVAVAIVSAALLLLGASGIYMWFTRRAERRTGLVLLGFNVAFAVIVLVMMRRSGP
jgi:hypothetical protein